MKRSYLIIQLLLYLFLSGFGFEANLNKINLSLVSQPSTLRSVAKDNPKLDPVNSSYNNTKSPNNYIKTQPNKLNPVKNPNNSILNYPYRNIKPQSNNTKIQISNSNVEANLKNKTILGNKNLANKNINNTKNNNTHLYKYINTPPIFTPSKNFNSYLNIPEKQKAGYQIAKNNTQAGMHKLVKGGIYETHKININYNSPAQKAPLLKLPKIKACKNSDLARKPLQKSIPNNSILNVAPSNIRDSKSIIPAEESKRKANVLQRFLSIFGSKAENDALRPLVSVSNNSQKLKSISRSENKISQLTNNTVKDLISDSTYRNLILIYGVFDEIHSDIVHNPKYLKVKHNPTQLSNEAQRIRDLCLNQKYLEEKLDKRIDEISKNLLALHSQYPLLNAEQLRNLYNIRSIKYLGNVNLALNSLQLLDNIVSHVPILVPSNIRITSHFGPRKLYKSPLRMHGGIDLVTDNRSIYASAAGIVELAHRDNMYGNFVLIKHANCKTRYAHLEKIRVNKGQIVKQGDLIGIEGATGRATGRHLHLEVLINQIPVDPIDFVKYSIGTSYKNEVAYKKKCAMEASLSKSQLVNMPMPNKLVNISMPNKVIPIKKKQIHLRKPSTKRQNLL